MPIARGPVARRGGEFGAAASRGCGSVWGRGRLLGIGRAGCASPSCLAPEEPYMGAIVTSSARTCAVLVRNGSMRCTLRLPLCAVAQDEVQ